MIPAQAPPEPAISIAVDQPARLVTGTDKDRFTVVARVSGDTDGELELRGTAAAYPRLGIADRKPAGRRARLGLAPPVTARYRVRLLDGKRVLARSRPFTVVAHPQVTLELEEMGGGPIRLDASGVLDRGDFRFKPRAGSATELSFYYKLRRGGAFKHLADAALTADGCCERAASHTVFDTTLLSGIESFTVCVPGRLFAGAGEALDCPPTLRAE